MHGKKLVGVIIVSLALALMSGCIVSSSPDNNQTVVMQPGESKTFSVTCIGGPIIATHIEDGFGSIVPDNEISIGPVGAFTITASTEGIGRHTVEINESVGYYKVVSPWGTITWEFQELSRDTREWDVVVCGVKISPSNTLVSPGAVQEYTAKAYPEGSYAYAWYLDGALSATGELYSFAPTSAQCGTHTLTVKATGSGTSYESTMKIQVPFATVGNNRVFEVLGAAHNALAQTSDGGYVIAATSRDTSSYQSDIEVFKLAADGSLQWHTILGGSDYDYASGVIETADGGFIVAGSSQSQDISGAANHGGEDIYLAKLDAQGAIVWQGLYGGSVDDEPEALIPTADGGFVVAGCSFSQDIPGVTGHGSLDFYVIKFNAEETMQWQRLYDVGAGRVSSIRQTTDGGYIMTGTTDKDINNTIACLLKLDPEGNRLWSQSYQSNTRTYFYARTYFYDVLETSDGEYLAAGSCWYFSILSGSIDDALVVKYDALGHQIWDKTYGGKSSDCFQHLLPTPSGDFLAIGYSYSFDIPDYPTNLGYAVKLNAEGKILRQERIPVISDVIPVTDGYIALRYVSDEGFCLVKDGEF